MKKYPLGSLTGMMAMSNLCATTVEDKASMNLGFTMDLRGEIDVKKLERAIGRLVSEKIMNTYLVMEGMNITAVEKDGCSFELGIEPVKGNDIQEKKTEIKRDTEKLAQIPLTLNDEKKSPYIFKLYKISDEYHVLFMLVHHTFLDFGAVMIAISHIFEYYKDEQYEYPKSKDFSEFMGEELGFMSSEAAKLEDEYWANETKDIRQPKLEEDVHYENDELVKEADLMAVFNREELNDIATRERTSLFNFTMLLIHMAIAKVNDCNDTVLQYAISNRSDTDYRFTLGCLTRVLFNRIEFEDYMKPSELNKFMRKKLGAGYQNRHVAGKTPFGAASYLAVNEDMGDLDTFPTFNGNPVNVEIVDLPRKLDFIAALVMPLDEDNIVIGVLTDVEKYGKQAKQLVEAIKLAKRFLVEYPHKTFYDFMRQDISMETLDLLANEDTVEIVEMQRI